MRKFETHQRVDIGVNDQPPCGHVDVHRRALAGRDRLITRNREEIGHIVRCGAHGRGVEQTRATDDSRRQQDPSYNKQPELFYKRTAVAGLHADVR